ncbi:MULTISPECIES: efflux RND transporter periplasmic adaptor subunit [Rhizobium/Agrobacterium group]|uniref:HlyD family secretion protein n=2 Tax=Rhizobium/Agrobacterium group TaxID=227290 RepID=B9K148_ALLAM|nr:MULTISPECIES: efflux RND transporter periplasmic adaptor subunit [Rhizobium/Agrobacterium group]ACM38596.1 HlyD family secretion protein [Allorhizobium ampelinum S4]MUO26705.1 efflux RND transporter periplasmic adaptor subunit [Agrobacterium vitis]MUO41818.1 efflux RND transporter periplasmic adaptor subunit [Agrobacterium vitis]MUP10318.1 efflux RND transporter periplasmic adaptor subunit [Agrobacterium vitis]NSZ18761.1 efflux RND transporter periplasmic adaptor subunit [Agrobacterium viti
MSSRKQRWALMGAGLGLVVSISAVSVVLQLPMSAAATAASAAAPAPAVPVTVSKVSSRNFTHWELFSGRLEAVERVDVRPRVGGAIQSVHFREGALVKAGDLLFTIDPAPYQAAVDQAEGQFASAEAKVDLARIELDRGLKLSGNSTISQSDMDQRRNSFTQAQAAMGTARAQLQSAQLELDYTQVRAPVSGRVGKLEVTAGNLVASGSSSSVLTTLVSVDPIYASFNVSEQLVAKALSQLPQTGAALADIDRIPVEIGTLADDGTPIKGKLQLINNQVDAASGTIGVRAVFDNPGGRLIPGQFVRVRMGQPVPENKILVSERAIGTDQDKKFVFVVDGDNKVNYRQIQLGAVAEGQRVVESGLTAGDTIVVNGLQRIKPGAVVVPQPEEKLAASK